MNPAHLPRPRRWGAPVRPLALALALATTALAQEPPAPGERETPPDTARPSQRTDRTPPPKSPEETNPDPGAALPELPPTDKPGIRMRRDRDTQPAPQSPAQFNPDPGAAQKPAAAPEQPFFQRDHVALPPEPETAPVPADQALPRGPLERSRLEPIPRTPPARDGLDPVPADLKLPRAGVRENRFIPNSWHAPESYPLTEKGEGLPPHAKAASNRWRDVEFGSWRRYTSGDVSELPYYRTKPERWHYYRQSVLKGDLPIHGQDLFLSLTASGEFVYENRLVTLPSGVSSSRPGSFDFFGQSQTQVMVANFGFQADLFRGETVFKPVEWLVRLKPVFNVNRVDLRETLVSPDPRGSLGIPAGPPTNNTGVINPGDVGGVLTGGLTPAPGDLDHTRSTNRNRTYTALQEAFVEIHLKDLTTSYDFLALKIGNQTFNSDFRGFIFNETNLGVRLFGNYDSNRWQYNLALFDLREKDTNSELNTFDHRQQRVFIANVYRQDFIWPGYTAQLSLLGNFDASSLRYDDNGGIVRPAPIGTVRPHKLTVGYLGWSGDGHIGRWNISHALYLAAGRDDFNGIAGQPVDIRAGMAALEVSYDRDWIRYKASLFYATGDSDPRNGTATGFDSIVDNTNFFGGPFSYYVRQGFNLAGTALGTKQRFSVLSNLRTSKTEGQANFVNPGLRMAGLGADIEVTPKLRAFVNANYILFDRTESLKTALLTNRLHREFGTDLGVGFLWRPLLKDNILVSAGYGALLPGRGFRDIYRTVQPAVPGFTPAGLSPRVDNWLYSGVLAVTFTY
ncbi:MAG: hypothetical protein HY302_14940 [Opitutae bacterium]|nr:hypothetical protein [Opitutae bacterium]